MGCGGNGDVKCNKYAMSVGRLVMTFLQLIDYLIITVIGFVVRGNPDGMAVC